MSSNKIGDKTKVCAIVGDAALGVHYFSGSGVNAGIKAAYELVEKVSTYINSNYDKKNIFEDSSFEDLIKNYNDDINKLNDKTLVGSLTVDLDVDLLEKQADSLQIDKNKVKCPSGDTSQKCNIRNNYIDLLMNSENKSLDSIPVNKKIIDTELLKVIQPAPKPILNKH